MLSYSLPDDNHKDAVKLIKKVDNSSFCTSTYGLVELYSVVSRRRKHLNLPDHIEENSNERRKIETTVRYCLKRLDLSIIGDEFYSEDVSNVAGDAHNLYPSYYQAIKLSTDIPLKSGDILQLGHTKIVSERKKIEGFVTLDSDFPEKEREISKYTDINIVTM